MPRTVQELENTVIEEFSEPEDLMEGIRGVGENKIIAKPIQPLSFP